jgi:hypothetical protein
MSRVRLPLSTLSPARGSGRFSDGPFTSWASRPLPLISRGLVREDVHHGRVVERQTRTAQVRVARKGREGSNPSSLTRGARAAASRSRPLASRHVAAGSLPLTWRTGEQRNGEVA